MESVASQLSCHRVEVALCFDSRSPSGVFLKDTSASIKKVPRPAHPLPVCLSLQEFKAVSKEDSGKYSCLASNEVGPSQMCEGKHMTIGVCAFPRRCFLPHLSAPEKISDAAGREISVGFRDFEPAFKI